MAKLTTKQRKNVPKSQMGLPGNATGSGAVSGTYPMPDRAHAANAKARATQQVKKGNLSPEAKSKIDAKANKMLGKSVKSRVKNAVKTAKKR